MRQFWKYTIAGLFGAALVFGVTVLAVPKFIVPQGGTGADSLPAGSILQGNGSNAISGTYNPIVSTITASSTTASSSFANGINLTKGCFAINGTCVSGGSGSGTDLLPLSNTWTGTNSFATGTFSALNNTIVIGGARYPATATGLQSAFDTCAALNCGGVYFPASTTISVNTTINLPSNMTFWGDGYNSQITLGPLGQIQVRDARNVTIRGIHIDGTLQSLATTLKSLNIINAQDIRVEDNFILNSNRFGIFVDADGSNITERIWILNNYVTGRGNADVLGGGPVSPHGTVKDVYIRGNYIVEDYSTPGSAQIGAGIDLVGLTGFYVENNDIQGQTDFGTEVWPAQYSAIRNNYFRPAVGDTCSAVGSVMGVQATSSYNNLDISNNVMRGTFIDLFGNATDYPFTNININGNTIDATGCDRGILLVNVTGANVHNNYVSSSSDIGILIDGGRKISVSNNTVASSTNFGIKSKTGSRESNSNSYFGNMLFGNGTDYNLSELDNETFTTYDDMFIDGHLQITGAGITNNYIGAASSTTVTGGATLYVYRTQGEGVAPIQAGTVAQFGSNSISTFNSAIGLISGSAASAQFNFGDYLNAILQTFFERKRLTNKARNWLNYGCRIPLPLEPVNGL